MADRVGGLSCDRGNTVGLTTIWFAGGALVAAIASGAGAGILVQWILFLVISLVLLILQDHWQFDI